MSRHFSHEQFASSTRPSTVGVWRTAVLAGIVLLAICPTFALAQYGVEAVQAVYQADATVPATIYPCSAFAPDTSVPEAHFVRPQIGYEPTDLQPTTFQLAAEDLNKSAQLTSFQQESVITPPATQPLPPGDLYRQMVHQDTAAPDLNGMINQPTYAPPPTGCCPTCTNDYHCDPNAWHSQVLPQGIIYQSYLAGTKEPRFATWFDQNSRMGDMWDVSLGAAPAFGVTATTIPIGPKAGSWI